MVEKHRMRGYLQTKRKNPGDKTRGRNSTSPCFGQCARSLLQRASLSNHRESNRMNKSTMAQSPQAAALNPAEASCSIVVGTSSKQQRQHVDYRWTCCCCDDGGGGGDDGSGSETQSKPGDSCRIRKTKCDRKLPCSRCFGVSIKCRYTHVPLRKGPKGERPPNFADQACQCRK